MANEKWKKHLIEKALQGVNAPDTVPPKVPGDAKYKKRPWNEHTEPTIGVGTKVAVRITTTGAAFRPGDTIGYVLGVVLDYDNYSAKPKWDLSTTVIIQIIKTTNTSLDYLIGRLMPAKLPQGNYLTHCGNTIVSFNTSEFKWV